MAVVSIRLRLWWAATQMNNPEIYSFTTGQGILLLSRIASLERLEREANAEDMREVATFTSPSRRAERLAWRIMLRRWAGQSIEVEYLPTGAPQIKNLAYPHISVAHCRDMVAVALSARPCAVDIETLNRNFGRIAERFMSDDEMTLARADTERAAIWCGKETLYKLYGRAGLDLKKDIRITSLDLSNGIVRGQIDNEAAVEMHLRQIDDNHIVVYHI